MTEVNNGNNNLDIIVTLMLFKNDKLDKSPLGIIKTQSAKINTQDKM